MFPKVTELQFEEQTQDIPRQGKSFLFDFQTGDFVYKDGKLVSVEGLDALIVWIEKTLRTERFRFKAYEDTEYGVTIDKLIGSNFPQIFIEAEIKREVTESLLTNELITNITAWEFNRIGSEMKISFTVVSTLGTQGVTFNV